MCSNSFRIITMLIFALLAFITNLFIPDIPVLVWYFANASIFSFILFGIDKLNAKKDRIRVPESSFHFLSLIGGTIGVMLGIAVFRHKLSSKGFLAIQFAIFIVYVVIAFFVIKNYSTILGSIEVYRGH